jgi:hypothetical protein
MDQAPPPQYVPPAEPIAGIVRAAEDMASADYEARRIAEEAIRRTQNPQQPG